METLIATVLIMAIFMVASLILNNLFSNSIKSNTRGITAKLNELEYLYINGKVTLPYYDDHGQWTIVIESIKNSESVIINASQVSTDKTIEKTIYGK